MAPIRSNAQKTITVPFNNKNLSNQPFFFFDHGWRGNCVSITSPPPTPFICTNNFNTYYAYELINLLYLIYLYLILDNIGCNGLIIPRNTSELYMTRTYNFSLHACKKMTRIRGILNPILGKKIPATRIKKYNFIV